MMKTFKFLKKNKTIIFKAPRNLNRMETYIYSLGWNGYCKGQSVEDFPYFSYSTKIIWKLGWIASKLEHENI